MARSSQARGTACGLAVLLAVAVFHEHPHVSDIHHRHEHPPGK